MRLRSLATLLLPVLAACERTEVFGPAAPVDRPTLTVPVSVVAPGVHVPVVATNQTPWTFGHGACDTGLDRMIGSTWMPYWDQAGLPCIMIVYALAPNGRYEATVPAPEDPGTYRATMRFGAMGADGSVVVRSYPFEVRAHGPVALALLADTVAVGGEFAVRFANESLVAWSYNTCMEGRLQRRSDGRWYDLPPSLALCAAVLSELGPGQARTETFSVPVGAPAGVYRVTQGFSRAADAVIMASAPFVVR